MAMNDLQTVAVGFVGLGLLGQAMALRLKSQGFDVVAWNRERERCAPLAAAGASIAGSPGEVAERCDVVCLCVLDAKAVRSVMFGTDGIATAAASGQTVLDFSTVDPAETRAIAAEALAAGIDWIDAPVSGGPVAAQAGTLTVMVGGGSDAVRGVERILDTVASKVTHVGPVGSGQSMKVVNQALVGATFVLLAEAMALARGLGLPVASVPSCLAGGMADSVALQQAWPRMAQEDFTPPTGRASQMLKDLECVDRLREVAGLGLPMLETATKQYRDYVAIGAGDEETVSIGRLYRPRTRN